MIVSHKHRFIFLKTRKTAGTSIEIALSKICGNADIITPISQKDEKARTLHSGRSAQNFKEPFKNYTLRDFLQLIKGKKKAFYNHMPYHEVEKAIGPDIWNSYYKFCFERNPYDRALSYYFWENRGADKSFSAFLKEGSLKGIVGKDLYASNNEIKVDKVFKFEDLEGSLSKLSQVLGLTKISLPEYKAKSFSRKDKRHYTEVINAEDRKIIEQKFKWELETFNYKF